MASAKEIAEYIVSRLHRLGTPVTNMKLHFILFFLWAAYYEEKKRYLFCDSIAAWPSGPVVEEVHYRYCTYGGLPIFPIFPVDDFPFPDRELKEFVDRTAERLINVPTFRLRAAATREGGAWDKAEKSTNPFRPILFSDIAKEGWRKYEKIIKEGEGHEQEDV